MPRQGKPSQSEWVVMVHMLASAPNLLTPLQLDLEELRRPLRDLRPDKKHLRVFVQIDTAAGITKRFELHSQGIERLEMKSTDPATTLADFVSHTVVQAPSKYAALIVWGHASGIGRGVEHGQAGYMVRRPQAAARAAGVAQAGAVWPQISQKHFGRKLDLVGFDACYMASAEVACELRDGARFMLAPQASIGLEGWHYDLMLDRIIARQGNQPIPPESLGRHLVRQIGISANSPDALTLLDLDAVGPLTNGLKALSNALGDAYEQQYREPRLRSRILEAFGEAAWAGMRQFVDLADLCRILASRVPDRHVRAAAAATLQALVDTKARANGSPSQRERTGLLLDHLCTLDVPLSGLSIYCPWLRSTLRLASAGARDILIGKRDYKNLKLSRATGWGNFLFDSDRMLDAERRWVRQEVQEPATRLDQIVMAQVAEAADARRVDGPKASSRADDPKFASRADDPKPAGRGDDPTPAHRRDSWGS